MCHTHFRSLGAGRMEGKLTRIMVAIHADEQDSLSYLLCGGQKYGGCEKYGSTQILLLLLFFLFCFLFLFVCLFVCLFFVVVVLLFFCVPQLYLWGSPLLGEVLRM